MEVLVWKAHNLNTDINTKMENKGAVESVTFSVIILKDKRFLSKFKHNYDESKFKINEFKGSQGEFRIKLLASSESKVHGSD